MSEWRRRRAARGWTTADRLRKLVLMCWAMLLLVSLTAIGSMQLQSENIRQLTLVTGPAHNANDDVRQAMTDAQTGLSAYQLSGDRELLQPYFGTRSRTTTALATLQDKLALGATGSRDASQHADLGSRQRLAAEAWWANAQRIEQALSRGERTDLFESRALFGRFLSANIALGERLSTALDQSQLAAQALEARGRAVTMVIALLALVAMLVLGHRLASTISRPLTALRDTMVRQREGDRDARAREDQGSLEVRSVARDFNALSEQSLALLQTQASALGGHQITTGIGRAIRAASDSQQALDVMCGALGQGLGADRVIASTFGGDHLSLLGAQWHRPDLTPVSDLSLLPELGGLAEELWLSNECLAQDDLFVAELREQERVRQFCRVTRSRAAIMVPIGFGDRLIGIIYVLMVDGPRAWNRHESDVVKTVAGFVARAIVEAENHERQLKYVEQVEMLDRQKSDFLATVSHELRTPLTSIAGYLELLLDGDAGELTEQQQGMLKVVGRSSVRLRSLIEDVLMLNRIEGGVSRSNFVEVSIHALITRVGQELWLVAQSSAIQLDIQAGPQTAVVVGDQASLDRAVLNVLSNAIKFSRPGGLVSITSAVDQEARRVLITCQDSGVGIPVRDQGHLFTRFFRASNATAHAIPGTGLGLSIVKQIVEDHHGGELRLTSVEDQGTTVVLDLPLSELAHTQEPQESEGSQGSQQASAAVGNDSQSAGVSAYASHLAH